MTKTADKLKWLWMKSLHARCPHKTDTEDACYQCRWEWMASRGVKVNDELIPSEWGWPEQL